MNFAEGIRLRNQRDATQKRSGLRLKFSGLIIGSMAALFFASSAMASTVPIHYQARILKPDGTPLDANVTLQFTIRSPNNCILWTENQTINLTGQKGALSTDVGLGTNLAAGAHTFSQIFVNTGELTGLSGCTSGTSYQPAATDNRTLLVTFNDGSGVNSLPALAIRSVPFAHFANIAKNVLSIMGRDLDSAATPANGEVLQYNSATQLWEPAGVGTGSVTSVDLAGGTIFNVTGGPITTSGTFNLAFANQNQNLVLASPDGSTGVPTFRALAAADIPNLPAAKITSGTLQASVGGTGLVPAVGDANKVYGVNAAGTGTEFKAVAAGTGINVDTSVAGTITISANNAGSVTYVGTGTGLAGGPINATGTISLADTAVTAGSFGTASSVGSYIVDGQGRLTGALNIPIALNANQITAGTLNQAQLGTYLATIPFTQLTGTISAAQLGVIDGSSLTNIAAGSITSGTLNQAQLGTYLGAIDAAQVATGTLSQAVLGTYLGPLTATQIPNLDADKITTGTFATARLGAIPFTSLNGTISIAQMGQIDGSAITSISGASITSGTINQAQLGTYLGTLDGSQITTGTIDIARLGLVPFTTLSGTVSVSQLGAVPFTSLNGTISTAQLGLIDGSSLTNIAGSSITSGTISQAALGTYLGAIDAAQVATGTLNQAQLGTYLGPLAGSQLTSGTIDTAILGAVPFTSLNGTISIAQMGQIDGSAITSISGSSITSGTINQAQLGTYLGAIDAAQVATGTLNQAQLGTYLGTLDGSQIATGTINTAQLGLLPFTSLNGTISVAQMGQIDGSAITSISGSSITSGTINQAQLGTYLGAIDAAQVSTGTLNQAQLGTYLGPLAGSQLTSGTIDTGILGAIPFTSLNGTISIAQMGQIDGSAITSISGSSITSGTINQAQLGTYLGAIDAAQVATGTLNQAQLGTYLGPLAGSQLTSGTIDIGILGAIPFTSLNGTISTAQIGTIDGSSLTNIAGSSITSGTLNQAQLGTYLGAIDAAQVATGTLNQAQLGTYLGTLDGSQIATGTINTAQLGLLPFTSLNGTISVAQMGQIDGSAITSISGSSITSGTINQAQLGTYLGAIDAAQVSTGTLNQAQLGTYLGPLAGSQLTSGTIDTGILGAIPFTSLNGTISIAQMGQIDGSAITSISGSSITSGTINQAQLGTYLGSIDAAQVATGTLNQAQLGTYLGPLAGSQLTSGTIDTAILGAIPFTSLNGTISTAQIGTIDGSSLTNIAGSSITSGTINQAQLGTYLGSLDGSQITSGTIDIARLGLLPFTTLSGTVSVSQLGAIPFTSLNGTISTAQLGTIDGSVLTNIAGSSITSGTINQAQLGTYLGTIATSQITTGTLDTARLGQIPNAITTGTSANTADTLVLRDGTGGFAAGTVSVATQIFSGAGIANIFAPTAGNYSLTLPPHPGTAGQVLTTNGSSGVLGWSNGTTTFPLLANPQGTAGAPAYSFSTTTNTGMYSPGVGTLAFATGGAERVRVNSDGHFGVNVDPQQEFDVTFSHNSDTTFLLRNPNAGASASARLYLETDGSSIIAGADSSAGGSAAHLDANGSVFLLRNALSTGSIQIGIDTNRFLTMNSAGSVGLGTVAPTAKLQVQGDIKWAGAGSVGIYAPTAGNYTMTWPSTPGALGQTLITSGTGGILSWGTPIATPSFPLLANPQGSAAAPAYSFSNTTNTGMFSPGVGTIGFSAGGNTAMTISASQSVGIGTTDPSSRLDVRESNSAGDAYISFQNEGSRGAFYAARRAGIGGTGIFGIDEFANVHVKAAGGGYATGNLTLATDNAQPILFLTTNAERMRLTSEGSLGIGTTAPTARLEVQRDIKWAGAGSVGIYAPTAGNYTMTWPSTPGGAGQVLTTNGTAGILAWSNGTTSFPLLANPIGTAGAPAYSFNGDTDSGFYSPGPNTLALSTGGTTRIHVGSDGAIGIGTIASGLALEVADMRGAFVAAQIPFRVTSNNAAGTGFEVVDYNNNSLLRTVVDNNVVSLANQAAYTSLVYKTTSRSFGFGSFADYSVVNGMANDTFAFGGSIGIGTAAPTARLQVQGDIKWAGAGSVGIYAPTAGNYTLTWPTTPGGAGQVLTTNGTAGILAWSNGTTSFPLLANPQGSAAAPAYSFSTTTDTGIYSTGVGTLAFSTAGTNAVTITNLGRVGIGTTSPTATVDIVGGPLRITNPLNSWWDQFTISNGSHNVFFLVDSDGSMNFRADSGAGYSFADANNGSSIFRILDNGSVGVGTTAPTAKLQVQGDIKWAGAGSVGIYAPTAGNYSLRWPTTPGGAGQVLTTSGTAGILDWSNGTTSFPLLANPQGSAGAPAYSFSTATDTGMYSTGVGTLAFSTAGTNAVTINNLGRVGIGTTAPEVALHVNGDIRLNGVGGQTWLENNNSNFNIYHAAGGILNIANTTGSSPIEISHWGTGDIRFSTAGAHHMRILNNGSIGIGTTAPTARLEVQRDIKWAGAGSVGIYAPTAGDYTLTWPSTPGTLGQTLITSGTGGILSWGTPVATPTFPLLANPQGTAGAPAYSFSTTTNTGIYSPGVGTLAFSTAGTNAVTINNLGYIGIGTTNPSASLEVNGQVRALHFRGDAMSEGGPTYAFNTASTTGMFNPGGTAQLGFSTGGTERVRINAAGSVGIGTTAPTALLNVAAPVGANDGKIVLQAGGENSDSILELQTPFSGANHPKTAIIAEGLNTWSRSDLHFVLNSEGNHNPYVLGTDTRLIIKNDGNVGIGTTAPAAKLQVQGDIKWAGAGSVGVYAPTAGDYTLTWPSHAGAAGQVLTTSGTGGILSWTTASGGTPAFPLLSTTRGSAGTPAYTFSSTSNTGMFSPGVGTLAFSAAGNEGFRVDSSGRLRTGPFHDAFSEYGQLNAFSNPWADTSGNVSTQVNLTTRGNTANSTATVSGIKNWVELHLDFNNNITNGIYNLVPIYGHGASATAVRGTDNELYVAGTGSSTITTMTGSRSSLNVSNASATVTHAQGFYSTITNSGGGAIANAYGIYIDSLAGTNRWGVYQVSNDRNYLAGTVGIGTSLPTAKLQVQGDIKWAGAGSVGIYAPTAGDYTLTWPAHAGSAGQVLTTSGTGGILSWTTASGGAPTFPLLANPQGSAAAPAYSFSTTTNTGMYSTGVGTLAFSTAGTNALTITNLGRVGIGKTAPVVALDIVGDVSSTGTFRSENAISFLAADGSATWPSYSFGDDATVGLWRPGTGTLGIVAGGSERLRVTAAGSVGIGTTAPTQRLDVIGNIEAKGAEVFITAADASGNERASIYASGSRGYFHAYDGGAENVRLDAGGNSWLAGGSVGIGATAPTARLQVQGDIKWAGAGSVGIYAPTAGDYTLTWPSHAGAAGQVLTTSGTSGILSWMTASGGGGSVTYPLLSTTLGSAGTPVYSFSGTSNTGVFAPGVGTLAFATAGTQAVTINNQGHVGIGTTSPLTQLHVERSMDANTAVAIVNTDAGANAKASFALQSNAGPFNVGINSTGLDGNAFVWNLANTPLVFGTNNTERIRIANSGNVGIGTTTTTYNLTMAGASHGTIGMEIINNPGRSLTLQAGGATNGGSNRTGGTLYLSAGQSTGNVGSSIEFRTATPGTSSSTVRAPSTKMMIAGNGNVGIGTTIAESRVDISRATVPTTLSIANEYLHIGGTEQIANGYRVIGFGFNSLEVNSPAYMGFLETDATASGLGALVFGTRNVTTDTYGSERMRIAPNGNVGIGTTAPSEMLDVAGKVRATNFIVSSDARFKRDIAPMTNAFEQLSQIRGVSYNWRQDEFPERRFSSEKQYGVIAQEVAEVFPDLVYKDLGGNLSVNYQGLIAPLIESVKEIGAKCDMSEEQSRTLAAQVANNSRDIASLKKENEELKKKLEAQQGQINWLIEQVQKK